MEGRAPNTWEWPEKRQVVVPLTSGISTGELSANIVLPVPGFGHAVLTTGEPRKNYAREDGGLDNAFVREDGTYDRVRDIFLWWDFHVSSVQTESDRA